MGQTVEELLYAIKADNADILQKMKKTGKSMRSLDKSLVGGAKKISRGINVLIGGAVAYATKRLFELAGQIDTVASTFDKLAAGARNGAKGLLGAMKEATAGTVKNLDIMKSANLAINLMGENVAKHLPEMAKVAKAAARAQGQDVAQMLNDIVVASGRQSVMILDNLGISSATAARYIEQYAASLGKTRQQLTETEKRAAFFHAVMKAGGEIYETSGKGALTLGEKIQVVKANASNAADAFAKELIPALHVLSDGLLENANLWEEMASKAGKAINEIVIETKIYNATMEKFEKMRARKGREGIFWTWEETKQFQELLQMERAVYEMREKERKRRESDAKKRITAPTRTLPTGKKGKKPATLAESEYLRYIGKVEEAEIASENEKLKKMEGMRLQHGMEIESIWDAHQKRIDDMETKHTLTRMQNGLSIAGDYVNQIQNLHTMAYQNRIMELELESANKLETIQTEYDAEKERIENSTMDEASRKEALKKLDKDYNMARKKLDAELAYKSAQIQYEQAKSGKKIGIVGAIINTALGVTKALASVAPPLSYVLAGITSALGAVQIGLIAGQPLPPKPKPPTYKKGFVPVHESGYVPNDHYLAYVGAREAVMNAEATRANSDLLRAMNEHPGMKVGGGDMVTNNYFKGDLIDSNNLIKVVNEGQQKMARDSGTEIFKGSSPY